jgi:hypothetical protein
MGENIVLRGPAMREKMDGMMNVQERPSTQQSSFPTRGQS